VAVTAAVVTAAVVTAAVVTADTEDGTDPVVMVVPIRALGAVGVVMIAVGAGTAGVIPGRGTVL